MGVLVQSSPDDSERFTRLMDLPMPMVYGLPVEPRRDLTKCGSSRRLSQLASVDVNEQRILYSVLLFSATMAV